MRKKGYLFYFVLLLQSLILSSCFELKEELYITKKGSGKYRLTADFSEHKDMISELLSKTDATEHNPFGENGNQLQEFVKTWQDGKESFSHIKGISNVKNITDTVNYIFGVSFDFDDVEALNLVLVMRDGGEYNPSFELPYMFEKKKIIKNDVFVFKKMFKYLLQEEDTLPTYLESQKKAIFAQVSYKCVISTEGKIKKVDNDLYEISEDKKKATYQAFVNDIFKDMAKISSEIKFK